MLCIKTKNINTAVLQAIIQKLKPTFCVNDMMPSHLLKQAFDCESPSLMHLINIRTNLRARQWKHDFYRLLPYCLR